jgi:hypothetical protein
MIRLLVDGIAFQPGQPATSLPWRELLGALANRADLQVLLLDRGRAPKQHRIELLPFPAYLARDCAADSLLIQQMADHFRADVFVSTAWTTPATTPAVLLLADWDGLPGPATSRRSLARETAIAHAQCFVCAGGQAASHLRALCPEIPDVSIRVAKPTVEDLCEQLVAEVARVHRAHTRGLYAAFLREWRRIRTLQASVDYSPKPA